MSRHLGCLTTAKDHLSSLDHWRCEAWAHAMYKDIGEGLMGDFALADLFDAYRRAVKLEQVRNAIEAREEAKGIKLNMELAIDKLVVVGVHAEARWAALRAEFVG